MDKFNIKFTLEDCDIKHELHEKGNGNSTISFNKRQLIQIEYITKNNEIVTTRNYESKYIRFSNVGMPGPEHVHINIQNGELEITEPKLIDIQFFGDAPASPY